VVQAPEQGGDQAVDAPAAAGQVLLDLVPELLVGQPPPAAGGRGQGVGVVVAAAGTWPVGRTLGPVGRVARHGHSMSALPPPFRYAPDRPTSTRSEERGLFNRGGATRRSPALRAPRRPSGRPGPSPGRTRRPGPSPGRRPSASRRL